ncbi:MAG TPA: tRNA preQ1(34) S-adenosylmethionine ribosyltransferase-isomerase QueA [Tepidiformaceae bacterium]|nr:tRNA preQ1(34) S-adenosylmethionine ribosyltransferase-isomerase QueA [Tepidiformaceae bacterium]
MRTDEFVFDLPPELIAQEPAEPRDSARLMVLRFKSQSVEHRSVRDLPELLRRGDLLVVNNTRVMAARLFGKRPDTGGKVEALLVRPFTDTTWEVLFKPARQARPGRRVVFETHEGELAATVLGRDDGPLVLEFERAFDPATVGEMPLPPYIKGFHGDPERYQTVYSRDAASAAAPTAGLHFTPGLLEQLRAGGIDRAEVTLEVGPGTFRPVSVDDPHDHILHSEHVTVPADAADAVTRARREQRRIVAVGTTVVRTLEHVSRERGAVEAYDGWTGLRILPGDRFQVVDALLTNFHLPKSTLLMLVCAFAGQEFVMEAYREAVRERYRFFSFGDAMLLLPE